MLMLKTIKEKMTIKVLLIPLLAIVVFLSTPTYSTYSKNYIDTTLKDAVVTYAVLRSLNAGVSVIQKSSVTVGVGLEGNIAIGEALDPINDAIERFSDMITLSVWVLGSQKALYEISGTNFMLFLVIFLAIGAVFINHPSLKKS